MSSYVLYYKKDKLLKFIPKDEVMDNLYEFTAILPTVQEIQEYLNNKPDPEIIKLFKNKSPEEIQNKIRKDISKIDNKIPLFNIYDENIYLITRENLYNRVIYQNYRFPDKHFFNLLVKKKKDIKEINQETDAITERKHKKLLMMIEFLEFFDLDILKNTYTNAFYNYATEVGKNLTHCTRPSFLPHFSHIKPYYTRSEMINMALNMNLIKPDNTYYDQERINKLCDIIRENDISAGILLQHQHHIIKENKVGLVQYYSLQGSYFINQYLRNQVRYKFKNEYLENIISSMWELINNAPAFDKDYIVYRFVKTDEYLQNIKIGDTYTESGFMSTTRDPFYKSDTYEFGFILLRIKIPKNIVGSALCVETVSHFPYEEEILFSPLSMFKLESKDDECPYYHTDNQRMAKIKTKYEFTYAGKKKIFFPERPLPEKTNPINFLHIDKMESLTLTERLHYFVNKYVNQMAQFITKIGDHNYTMTTEWYNSTGAYKNFYAANVQNGFLIYCIHNNYVLFMIELGEEDNVPYMYVNYYVKYSTLDRKKILGDENFIYFLSSIAYYFEIGNVVIYADYLTCDIQHIQKEENEYLEQQSKNPSEFNNTNKYYGGSYCVDFYRYFKTNYKRFEDIKILNFELSPQFSYDTLDDLKLISPLKILKKDDPDEIYQRYIREYKNMVSSQDDNLANFYIWMIENKCYLLENFVDKMSRIFKHTKRNPFSNDYYFLDPSTFLYNRKYINTYPEFIGNKKYMINLKRNIISVQKNIYRERTQIKQRTQLTDKETNSTN